MPVLVPTKSQIRFRNFVVALVGLLFACSGALFAFGAHGAELPLTESTVTKAFKRDKSPTNSMGHVASRFSWPSLGQDKTIALGEALKQAKFKPKVVVWCATVDCTDLASDLDDAFQIASVPSDIDRRELESSTDSGLFVGPPGDDADKLVRALQETTGIRVGIVEAPHDAPLALIIGKRPK